MITFTLNREAMYRIENIEPGSCCVLERLFASLYMFSCLGNAGTGQAGH